MSDVCVSDIQLILESDEEPLKVKKLKRKRLTIRESDDSTSDSEDKTLKYVKIDINSSVSDSGNKSDKNGKLNGSSKHRRKKKENSLNSDSSEYVSKLDCNNESNEQHTLDNLSKQQRKEEKRRNSLISDSFENDFNEKNKSDLDKPVNESKKLSSLSSDGSEPDLKSGSDIHDNSNQQINSDDLRKKRRKKEKINSQSSVSSENSFKSTENNLDNEEELQVIQPSQENGFMHKKKKKRKNRLNSEYSECDLKLGSDEEYDKLSELNNSSKQHRKNKKMKGNEHSEFVSTVDSENVSNEQYEADHSSKQEEEKKKTKNSEDSESNLNSDNNHKSNEQSNSHDLNKQEKKKKTRKFSQNSDSSEQSLFTDVQLEEYDSAQEDELDIEESDEENGFTIDKARTDLYKATPEEKQKLASMKIKLVHKVPRQHKIEQVAGTRALSKEEKEEFSRFAQLKRGVFTSDEDRLIKRNWLNFCNIHNWDRNNPKPFLQMRHKNITEFMKFDERMKFIKFLANGLFDRSLYSVYQRFKVLYDPHKKSRYNRQEDNTIVSFVKQHKLINSRNRKFADLALILKRTRASVWRRYRVLKKRNLVDKITHDMF